MCFGSPRAMAEDPAFCPGGMLRFVPSNNRLSSPNRSKEEEEEEDEEDLASVVK